MSAGGVPDAATERWEDLLADAEATAAEYEADGWETIAVTPGDVTVLTGRDRFGFDVLAPGDEYETLREAIDGATVDTTHVYGAEEGDARFYVVVAEATDAELAVVVPTFAHVGVLGTLERLATAAGAMYVYVRPLSDESRVTVVVEDPAPFFE